MPGVRMPATGAALWDAVLVPLALQSETLRSTLAGMGITPNGFAQIIGRPGPADLTSRLVRWTGKDLSDPFEPASAPGAVSRLKPATTESLEFGFRGSAGGRFAYSLDLHATRVSDLVGPLEVATPTLYLDGPSVDAFLLRRMIAVGIPAGVADRMAENIAATTASVPLGTLAPDQREGTDVVFAYRNLGEVRLWGADLGVRWHVTSMVSVLGSFTYLSKDCFDLDTDGICGTAGDVTLNAPDMAGMATVRFRDPRRGVTMDGRVRHAKGFPVVASGYRGEVPAHTLLDLGGRVSLPWAPGVALSMTVTNVLDASHRDFVGSPEIGRLALITLQYAF
jgi:iron complex outermembrane receptor protein